MYKQMRLCIKCLLYFRFEHFKRAYSIICSTKIALVQRSSIFIVYCALGVTFASMFNDKFYWLFSMYKYISI